MDEQQAKLNETGKGPMPESALERKLSVFKPKRKKMTFNQLSSLISKDDLFNPKTKDSIIKDVREKFTISVRRFRSKTTTLKIKLQATNSSSS